MGGMTRKREGGRGGEGNQKERGRGKSKREGGRTRFVRK